MKEISGTSNRVLEVDLTTRSFSIYTVSGEERRQWLGAKGLGLKLVYDRMPLNAEPLGPENIIALMPGVLMGTGAPCSGRFHAVTRSPLTGIMTSSSCGGPFGMQLKTAGWDGLLLKGASPTPVILRLDEEGVVFEDGQPFWGMDTQESQKALASGKEAALVIGPAGENLVAFANVASGHRFLGRGGMGAVLGAKKVKAIVAKGGVYKIVPKNAKAFERAKKRGNAYIQRNETSSVGLRNYGTNMNLNPNNEANILPVENFRAGRHDRAFEMSGEMTKDLHDTRFHTCKPCTILCGHSGSYGGKRMPVPEFETTVLLGTNLGIFDREKNAEWNRICSDLGMDTISAGGTLAWVMEASEKGLVESPLRFGSAEGVSEALISMVKNEGLGAEMAKGCRYLASRYGGEAFAMQVKGLEMAAYDPRGSMGQGLAYAVANRGACHLSAYLVALEVYFGLLDRHSTQAKAEFVIFFENLTCVINALQSCQFTMFAYTLEPPLSKYTPDFMLAILMRFVPKLAIALMDFSAYTHLWTSITGERLSSSDILKAGERIHVLERYMNTRMGISRKDDTLPERLLRESRRGDKKERTVPLKKMLDRYYDLRAYDENGVPTQRLLRDLGIPLKNCG
ncbi:aldehyde ferredoxin oxidoreductase family protein [Desulfobotulus sp.]|jgi:aldehyde:ferredoxin oxidoreductase|uniref:aldehyde ferredoxin oxidoreductase family protein n=1 Tax=Desulfobotulus sp. TaxID=1940337 RepID=UPI002A358DCF|nr:aldehyde ferredoxin oxidoreductase family protein [Desulfobotulus sp.]MDY0161607.1 aldehyde ferredoxin oxidoreductase family protein [Desulfobotulus sp.]